MSKQPDLAATRDVIADAARNMRIDRARLNWSTSMLADRARAVAAEEGVDMNLSQQTISAFEQGNAKRVPGWLRYARAALRQGRELQFQQMKAEDQKQREERESKLVNVAVRIQQLPTYAGAGGGGTGEGEPTFSIFPRYLVEKQLKAQSHDLVGVRIEGNSMSPDFESGDQLLVDKRRTSVSQPGAFCLWDGDGYVVKYLEKVPTSDPPKLRVISRNPVFSTIELLADQVQILGRVVWLARQV